MWPGTQTTDVGHRGGQGFGHEPAKRKRLGAIHVSGRCLGEAPVKAAKLSQQCEKASLARQQEREDSFRNDISRLQQHRRGDSFSRLRQQDRGDSLGHHSFRLQQGIGPHSLAYMRGAALFRQRVGQYEMKRRLWGHYVRSFGSVPGPGVWDRIQADMRKRMGSSGNQIKPGLHPLRPSVDPLRPSVDCLRPSVDCLGANMDPPRPSFVCELSGSQGRMCPDPVEKEARAEQQRRQLKKLLTETLLGDPSVEARLVMDRRKKRVEVGDQNLEDGGQLGWSLGEEGESEGDTLTLYRAEELGTPPENVKKPAYSEEEEERKQERKKREVEARRREEDEKRVVETNQKDKAEKGGRVASHVLPSSVLLACRAATQGGREGSRGRKGSGEEKGRKGSVDEGSRKGIREVLLKRGRRVTGEGVLGLDNVNGNIVTCSDQLEEGGGVEAKESPYQSKGGGEEGGGKETEKEGRKGFDFVIQKKLDRVEGVDQCNRRDPTTSEESSAGLDNEQASQETQATRRQETQANMGQETQAKRGQETQAKRGQETQATIGQDKEVAGCGGKEEEDRIALVPCSCCKQRTVTYPCTCRRRVYCGPVCQARDWQAHQYSHGTEREG